MRLSTDERRALGIILGLLLLASLGRWIERPRPLLPDVPDLDIAALEEASRAARPAPRPARVQGVRPDAAATDRRAATVPGAGGGAATAAGRIDVNTADAAELQRLPGIGPAVAARIVEARGSAPFTGLDDVQRRVRGIGPALAARLEEHVLLPAASAAPAGMAGAAPQPAGQPVEGRPAAAASGALPPMAAPIAGASVTAIDLNRASAAELEKISGVGPILAARLVARRDSLGGYSDWAEVDAVPGVGPAMLARLKGLAVIAR